MLIVTTGNAVGHKIIHLTVVVRVESKQCQSYTQMLHKALRKVRYKLISCSEPLSMLTLG